MVTPAEIPDHRSGRPIGRGSYGEVGLAITAFETLRAVKGVRRAEFADPAPYQRELAGIRKFEPVSRNHPGLIDILHVGTAPDESWFYYVMEAADDASSEGTGVDAYVPLTLRRRLESRGLLNSH